MLDESIAYYIHLVSVLNGFSHSAISASRSVVGQMLRINASGAFASLINDFCDSYIKETQF